MVVVNLHSLKPQKPQKPACTRQNFKIVGKRYSYFKKSLVNVLIIFFF